MKSLLNELKKYNKKNVLPMHMPGHKRKNKLTKVIPYNIDITEIDGFDNLHSATGILKQSMDMATNFYKTKQSFYLVNGSTCGILASIRACTNYGDKIIIARNCHKSVYHSIELCGLESEYVYPLIDEESGIFCSITKKQVENAIILNKTAKVLVITSPTYEGVISDISSIARVCHKYGVILIVDEAHGAHLCLDNKSSATLGADIVINSLHKTLPSLTQTAILHLCSERVDLNRLKLNLAIFETSSPSYILLSSIDLCINYLTTKAKNDYDILKSNLNCFGEKIKTLKNIKVLCKGYDTLQKHNNFYDFDITKIVIYSDKISGQDIMSKLRQKKIELEMASSYALAMTTIFDSKKDIQKLYYALVQIDKEIENKSINFKYEIAPIPMKKLKIADTYSYKSKLLNLDECVNKISKEYLYVYPPGIPFIVPGEIIDKNTVNYIKYIEKIKLEVKSTNYLTLNKVEVIVK